jgi:hypothetical protein
MGECWSTTAGESRQADGEPRSLETDSVDDATGAVEGGSDGQERAAGLKKEDFTVLDEGKPQEIAFFSGQVPPTKACMRRTPGENSVLSISRSTSTGNGPV